MRLLNWLRPVPDRLLSAAVLLVAMSCDNPPTRPLPRPTIDTPRTEISDASRGGNPHFHFLPPLAKSPTYSGVSDDSQPVNVVVCAWNTAASQCGDVVAAFSRVSGTGSEVVRYDAAEQRYLVNWHTDRCLTGPCTLDPATTYRIRVLSGVLELGFVDIKVAATGGQAKRLDNGDYISLVNGRTLPVAFRVEQGAVSVVPRGQSSTIGTTGGNVSTFDGDVSLAIPGGAVASPVDITVETATDTPPAGEWSTPVDLGPDGATFAAPVKLTLRFDPTKLPQGVPAEALARDRDSGTALP